ncbi:hypothetical protein [Bacillus halotolerans]|uniref:hypothetical protein n=1 Tax=Bacillus halotolerans TaxID=260554 RepID=UPI0020C52FD8|nr:hypothetical protein [Bacillus halotolerans]UTL71236.1 hypothetical protein NLV76_12515 [Bacillus halotolerans]
MLFLIMGDEKIEVASAMISDDSKNVTAYRKDGSRAALLEGVNLKNVYLEDGNGNRVKFDKQTSLKQEIVDLRTQLKQLTEAVELLSVQNTETGDR